MCAVAALPADRLLARCDEAQLGFASTAELPGATEVVGQQRAVEAIGLALSMDRPGYNLFVLGHAGSGRHCMLRRMLAEHAAHRAPPADWCYVNNFAEPGKPRLLQLPAGRGARLAQDMERFVSELVRAIPVAFESEQYQARLEAIQGAYKQREEGALQQLGEEAAAHGIALMRTPQGFVFAPLHEHKAMSPAEFDKLAEDDKQRIGGLIEGYGERLTQLMQQLPRWRRETQAQIREANRETLALAAGHLIDELRQGYADLPQVQGFLDEVMHDVLEVGEQLREESRADGGIAALVMSAHVTPGRWKVNPLITQAAQGAAPVVFEDNPTHPNLVGRIDQVAQLGTLVTNFTLIRAGALHRANGGYLVLDALKLLTQPYAWDSIKRTLRAGQLRIESLGQAWGLVGSIALEPQPMPLALKLVLVGEPRLYYLLKDADPEFADLFRVAADFGSDMPRDAAGVGIYADFIATLARQGGLRAFQRGAVARLVEHASRLAGDGQRLSCSRRLLGEVLHEAEHLAGGAGREQVARADVDAALRARERRVDRLRERMQDQILRDNLLISVQGERVGQVNGLAVIAMDDFAFAHPVRISATVRVGEAGVVDIERESELGGSIHSKGVMILSAFLGARYARAIPLSLSASLVFEQSYGPVEGDSASLAELCALLSDLADVPVRQSLAITGSVNQFGEAQAIGGVNEKIEGFFDICAARGLSGEQGVLIPQANVKHLMLREDVVQACAEGRFHVWPVRDVDEAIECLTGVPAGQPDEQGLVPADTVNFFVGAQLAELAAIRQAYAAPARRSRAARDDTPPAAPKTPGPAEPSHPPEPPEPAPPPDLPPDPPPDAPPDPPRVSTPGRRARGA